MMPGQVHATSTRLDLYHLHLDPGRRGRDNGREEGGHGETRRVWGSFGHFRRHRGEGLGLVVDHAPLQSVGADVSCVPRLYICDSASDEIADMGRRTISVKSE